MPTASDPGRNSVYFRNGAATLSELRYQPLGVSGANCVTFLQQHFGLAIECPAGLRLARAIATVPWYTSTYRKYFR